MQRIDLFVIDGQNDFCTSGKETFDMSLPAGGKRPGALSVLGADAEAVAVAKMIDELEAPNHPNRHLITYIHATLDSHHLNDCAHNVAWRDANGQIPGPFTIVNHKDVADHKYVPHFATGHWEGKNVSPLDWALKYTKALEDRGRNPLCLWPPHCLIQTWGCCIYHPLQEAYNRWAMSTGRWVDFITKGDSPFTEHYSAMVADVPDPTNPRTGLNTGVLNNAAGADMVVWCGWAGSHCLKWTALDAIKYFTDQGKNEFLAKSVFLEDASAAVGNVPGGPDFAQWRVDFLNDVKNRGARVMKIDEFVKEAKRAA